MHQTIDDFLKLFRIFAFHLTSLEVRKVIALFMLTQPTRTIRCVICNEKYRILPGTEL